MREAVKSDEFGVDEQSMPANELLGDLLLKLHQSTPAREAYEAALKEAPNRFNSLYGAALSAQLEGKEGSGQVVLRKARHGRRPWNEASRVSGSEGVSQEER